MRSSLECMRLELDAERERVLITLRETRDKLHQVDRLTDKAGARDLILAFEIVITVIERETFADMPVVRIEVVLRHMESRLRRLQEMLVDARSTEPLRTGEIVSLALNLGTTTGHG